MHVRRMWLPCQAVGDPHVDALIEPRHIVAQFAEIYRISYGVAALLEAQAKRGRAAVWLVDVADRSVAEPQFLAELARFSDRPIEIALCERISKAQLQFIEHVRARVSRYRSADELRNRTKLINSMTVIPMCVGHDDTCQPAHLRIQQLLP